MIRLESSITSGNVSDDGLIDFSFENVRRFGDALPLINMHELKRLEILYNLGESGFARSEEVDAKGFLVAEISARTLSCLN